MGRPRKKNPSKPPKGHHAGIELPPQKIEEIIQTFAVLQNKRATAKRLSLSEGTIYKYLKQVPTEELKKRRIEAHNELAGKVHEKVETIVDSISPEDLESGRIKLHDAKGEFAGYKYWGPTPLQKGTLVGILTDKMEVLERMKTSLQEGIAKKERLLPETIRELKSGLMEKLVRVRIIDAQFDNKNPDLSQRIQQTLQDDEIRAAMADPVDSEELDFDNPNQTDANPKVQHGPVETSHTD